MKKSILATALLGALSLASCSDDSLSTQVADGTEVAVTLTAQLPGSIASRSISDGLTADYLRYAVYEAGTTTPVITDNATFGSSLTTQISLKLLSGRSYEFVFWADAQGTDEVYAFDAEARTITVDYDAAKANDENRDAFFGQYSIAKVSGPINETITLRRPFAQINVGTDDWAEAKALTPGNAEPVYASSFSTTAYKAFNLFTGEVEGEAGEVTFALNPVLPNKHMDGVNEAEAETLTVTVEGEAKEYDYLGMNYILMAPDQETVNITFNYVRDENDANDYVLNLSNVPAQRNYRTNILGSLLTNPALFTIVKDPIYDGDHNVNIWDGTTEELVADEDGNYSISTPGQLAEFAKMVNEGERFSGKTVTLTADIDLSNMPWTPAGNVVAYPSKTFAGTFDGDGHTISNLNASDVTTVEYATAGLFGSLTGKVKNLTIDNATVTSQHYAGVICGFSSANVGMEISNCIVRNSTVISRVENQNGEYNNGDKVGGIIGYAVSGDKITECSVENVTIEGYRDLGGIVGSGIGTYVTNCSASNVTITQNLTNGYKPVSEVSDKTGEILGRGAQADRVTGNTASNVTINVIGTSATLADLIAAGGNVTVNEPVDKLDLTTATKALNLTLNANVGSMTLGAFAENVTVNVASGVEFPKFTISGNLENFTLTGDPKSDKTSGRFTISGTAPKNITFDGVHFGGDGVYNYGNVISDLTVKNCVFSDMKAYAAISLNKAGDPSGNIVIENCKIDFTEGATTSANGIYLMNVTSATVKGCTISGGNAHGINIRPTEAVTVDGNTITGDDRDGIKIEALLGVPRIAITNNSIQCRENGIRIKDPVKAESITVTGNTINTSEFKSFDTSSAWGEPWGILIWFESLTPESTPTLTVTGNTETGNCGHWIKTIENYASDSVIE